MLRDGVTGDQFLDFHAHERFAERRGRAEQNGRRLAREQFLINARLRVHAINRRDEQTVHAARQEPADAIFLAFGQILRVGEQEVVAQLVRPLFEREKHTRKNRVGDGRDGDAEQLRGARAQPLRGRVGNVTHLLREQLDARPRRRRHVGFVAQRLGNRHHGDADFLCNVLEANHG